MSELMQLDLPAPVAPAIRMWGISARLARMARPAMSRPMATSSGWVARWASGDDRMSPRATSCRCRLGTSTPMADRPGIGARIRTSADAMAYAMSLCKLVTLATLTPGPSSSSKRVTVGPTVMPTRRVSTPWAARASSSVRPRASTIFLSTSATLARLSSASGGNRQAPGCAAGPNAMLSCLASASAAASEGTRISTFDRGMAVAPGPAAAP